MQEQANLANDRHGLIHGTLDTQVARTQAISDAINSNSERLLMSTTQISSQITEQGIEVRSHLATSTENLKNFMSQQHQQITNDLLLGLRDELLRQGLRQNLHGVVATESTNDNNSVQHLHQSAFTVDTRKGTAALDLVSVRDSLPRCRCKSHTSASRRTLGPFGLRIESGYMTTCPLHGQQRSWGVFVTTKLSPVLNGVLDMALGFQSGGRQWGISQPLRFRATVKRSESPLFQAFDTFQQYLLDNQINLSRACTGTIRVPKDCTSTEIMNSRGSRTTTLVLHTKTIDAGVAKLFHEINRSLSLRLAIADDRDEHGSTLLHVGLPRIIVVSGVPVWARRDTRV
jgi:hypothetical protein